MQLTFLRHGDAHVHAESDSLRPLSEEGRNDIQRTAQHLKNAGEIYDLIFSSPLLRAKETALIMAREFGLENHLKEDERLACGCRRKLIEEIVRENSNASHLLLVGHAPDLGIIASELLGLSSELEIKKGGAVKIHSPFLRPGTGKLSFFIYPELFS